MTRCGEKENRPPPSNPLPLSYSSALDHTVKVYQMPGAKLLYDLTLHTNPVYSIAFSPNGRYLASGSMDKLVFVYDLATGAVIKSYNCEGRVYDVKWDHKSERIAVSKSPCEVRTSV